MDEAGVQDCDGAVSLLKGSRRRHSFVKLAYADDAYNGECVALRCWGLERTFR